ncbi:MULTISPECIES: SdpI family protein [Bacillaceae]|uniref:Membrane protein n=1 Tax=Peribacillus huizhouensis TaxID=1501239 RepID=A0ABR6CL39_9BACI|nr:MULTISPECIES: SdpI family protein [Bacillaceae]MBA9025333.1 putative membrane protein [Peribacillus huizhouensis]
MKKHLLPGLLIAATAILWFVFYQQLPARIPIHWNLNGVADGYATKFNALLINLGMMIFLHVLLIFSPKFDPKRKNYQKFSRPYSMITMAILFFLFLLNALVIFTGIGYDIPIGKVVPFIVGILFIVLGNYMHSVKPNYFIGIRTPWTLSNDTVWKKTHRFGSRIFILAGVLFMLIPFLPSLLVGKFMFSVIFLIILLPIAYSYWIFRRTDLG